MGDNVIQLNGKLYDAVTGAYLGKTNVVPKHITDFYVHGKVIDGFVRPSHQAAQKPAPTPKPEAQKQAPKPVSADVKPAANPKRQTANHIPAHHPQHSKTLMHRNARKPEFTLKPAIKTQAPAEIMAKPASAIAHKRSVYSIDPSRRERAAITSQHHTIRHFHTSAKDTATHKVAHVPAINVRPAPLSAAHPPRPAKTHTDIFEAAIANASSHQQPLHKVRRHKSRGRKLANSLAFVAAFLVIGGFVGYLNMPMIEMRVASVQAGFGASMPAFAPTGYALEGGVKRTGGTVSLSFRSGDQSYTITQQSSNWNSQTLLDNTLALNGRHETVQKNGQTIYIYDNSTSASWVNGGVRYDITGNAQLSKDDIVAIATSL